MESIKLTRRNFVRMSALAAAGGFLVGCGCGPGPEPTTAATKEIMEEPTEVAAKLGGIGEGVKIVFFPGGPPGGPFCTVVYNGAVAAAADTGAEVSYMFSDWNTEKMITQFKEAMATSPDGICVMGHPGEDAFEGPIDDAFSQGIIVTSQNTT
ncbi:MAG: twin-arginine translocation signal domain-containing protein, partial [Anaerolineae bacterium]